MRTLGCHCHQMHQKSKPLLELQLYCHLRRLEHSPLPYVADQITEPTSATLTGVGITWPLESYNWGKKVAESTRHLPATFAWVIFPQKFSHTHTRPIRRPVRRSVLGDCFLWAHTGFLVARGPKPPQAPDRISAHPAAITRGPSVCSIFMAAIFLSLRPCYLLHSQPKPPEVRERASTPSPSLHSARLSVKQPTHTLIQHLPNVGSVLHATGTRPLELKAEVMLLALLR